VTEPCTGILAPEFAERMALIDGLDLYGPGERTPHELARLAAFEAPYGPLRLPACQVRDEQVPGPHGPIPVRVYATSASSELGPALVWLHGGAFLGGDLDMPEADHTARFVAGSTGRPVVSADYRLAVDGVHHPVPEDDALAAYLWSRDGGTGLGVDPNRVAIGGASAGACLSASVALRLRDAGTPPWRVFMVYPTVHSVVPEPTGEHAAALAQLVDTLRPNPAMHTVLNENYVGGPPAQALPYAFPGDGHDLTGLPPVYIENCEFDDLRSSGELFAQQLAEAGVPVEQVCAAGVPHAHLNWQGSERAYATLQRISDRLTAPDQH
jgi:acetyl esterase/lipase